MTKEEAIRIIETVFQDEYVYKYYDSITHQALDMAIEALTQDSRKVTQEFTQDLISRQDALKPFCIAPDGTRIPEVDCDNFPVEFSVEFIKKHLLSLPSADRPTGEWIFERLESPLSDSFKDCYKCSNCGTHWEYDFGYCPNCGSKNGGRAND